MLKVTYKDSSWGRKAAQMHGPSFNGASNTLVTYVTQRSLQRMFDNFCVCRSIKDQGYDKWVKENFPFAKT